MKFLFLLITLSTFATVHEGNQEHSAYNFIENLRNSHHDKVSANNIYTIYRLAEKNNINKNLISKALTHISEKSIFNEYRWWLKELHEIDKYKIQKDIVEKIKYFSKHQPEPIKRKLAKQIRELYLIRFIQLLPEKNNFSNLDLISQAFMENIRMIKKFNIQSSLSDSLKSIKRNKKDHHSLSMLISKIFMEADLIPNKKLLANMNIDPQLTSYIQGKGLHDLESKNIFNKELEKKIQGIYDTEDQNGTIIAVNNFISFIKKFHKKLSDYKIANSIIRVAKHLNRKKHFNLSREVTSQPVIVELNSKYHEDIHFEILWSFLQQDKPKQALDFIEHNNILANKYHLSSKTLYWISFVFEKNKRIKIAQELRKDIIKNHPVSFYAILSAKDLIKSQNNTSSIQNLLFQENNLDQMARTIQISSQGQKILTRLASWSYHGYQKFIDLEQQEFYYQDFRELYSNAEITVAKKISPYLIASIHHRSDNYLQAFKVLYPFLNDKTLTLDQNILELLYPAPYRGIVEKSNSNLRPVVLLSLIRQESGFNANAISSAGARGLMQLMPTTANQLRKRYIASNKLHNPELNVELGTKYINYLYQKFDNNLAYSLAAYNAGESRVSRWISEYLNHPNMLFNIEDIPFNETRNYVKLIYRNIFFYELLNSKQEQGIAGQLYSALISE